MGNFASIVQLVPHKDFPTFGTNFTNMQKKYSDSSTILTHGLHYTLCTNMRESLVALAWLSTEQKMKLKLNECYKNG